jgi:hypothetical protein
MDGLIMIILLFIGAVGGYCFAALAMGGDKPYPPAPPRAVKDPTLYRHVRDWDNR